jgi:site-specific recombinase XerD
MAEQFENVPEPSQKYLNQRQALDYEEHRSDLIEWLQNEGKNPRKYEGYSEEGAENYARRIDQFYRWVWQEYDGYTTAITHEQADEFVDQLAADEVTTHRGEPYCDASKRKWVNAIETLFRWRDQTRGGEEWEPEIEFSDGSHSQPDAFTRDERAALREAVLEYESIPQYDYLSPEERDRWRGYLAQKLGKPKDEVVPDDWNRVNRSWKIPSLIHVSLDAGLRPCEVEEVKTSWLRLQKGELHIPKEESSKNRDEWEVTLNTKTVKIVERWLEQRENKTKYDDTELLWLNRKGNPYNSATLNPLLRDLMEETGIDQTNRKLTWYSIRHSLGTHMTEEGNLAQTKAQLRHKSLDSTLQYTDPSNETVRDTLDNIG